MCIRLFGFWFWRYLTRGLIWYLNQTSIRPSIYLVRLWNHTRIRSWNQPVLSNNENISCSRKQREPLMGLEPTTSTSQTCNPLRHIVQNTCQVYTHLLYTHRLLDSLVVECWHRVREVPGSIPSQGPRHTKDVIEMVPVVPLFSTEHSKGKYWLFLKN